MFEYSRIPCHECRCGKAEHLPIGKIPGHDRQNHPQGMEGDIALRRICRDMLLSQEFLSMLSKIIAVPGTFFDLGLGFSDRFAHFQDS